MALNYIVVSNHGSVCCMLYHTNVESKGVSKLSQPDQFSEVLPAWQLFPTVTGTPIHDFHKITILFSEWGMVPALIDKVFGHTTMYDSRSMGVPHVLGRSACVFEFGNTKRLAPCLVSKPETMMASQFHENRDFAKQLILPLQFHALSMENQS